MVLGTSSRCALPPLGRFLILEMAVEDTSRSGGRNWPSRIREALDRDRFVLHAQPIVELESGETIRHELFLRMVEEDELIPAASFVPAVEEHGAIRETDQWVVATAIEGASTGRGVHVNLSVCSTDEALLELVREKLEASGTDPRLIVFELREEQLRAGVQASRKFISGSSELGCRLALDRFVAEGDDRTLLESLPIDFLKIGPRLMDGLLHDPTQRRVIESVV